MAPKNGAFWARLLAWDESLSMLVRFWSSGWLAMVDLIEDVNELVVNGRFGGGIWHF